MILNSSPEPEQATFAIESFPSKTLETLDYWTFLRRRHEVSVLLLCGESKIYLGTL